MTERIREFALPTSGGVSGSLLSVNMGNITDTIILAAFGAVVGIVINEVWKCIKRKCKTIRDERDNK